MRDHSLLVLSLILITGQVIADQTDRDILVELKQYLESNNKVHRGAYSGWNLSDSSPCNWSGITCNVAGRVTGVDLSQSNISSPIFGNFSLFTELTYLNLSANTINGVIPLDLDKCSKLQHLDLSHNTIEGEFNLTGLVNLQTLNLTLNRFHGGIQSTFPALCHNLVSLSLSTNNFTGEITGCFDECPKLRYLDLSTNNFSGEMWQGFAYLEKLTVSENNLSGKIKPSAFPANCNLKVLDVSANNLYGVFPGSVANCSKLNYLILWGNEFNDTIPSEIGSLSELQILILGKNKFDREIPRELLNCTKLEFLDLSSNNFGGDIQEIFGQFTTVKYLVLHGNKYTGGIESSNILTLSNITRLDLSNNYFTGNLPIQIAAMPSLKLLFLSNNSFNGTIPPAFGSAPKLQALDLSYNELTGEIPPTIGKLTSLLWLMLANNQLTGKIPPEIGNCSSLLWLNLANNQLTGVIPPEISRIGENPFPTFDVNRREMKVVNAGSGECLTMKRWLPASYPPFSFVYSVLTRKTCRTVWDRMLKGYGLFPLCLNSSSPVRTLTISGYIQLSGNLLSGEVPPKIGQSQNLSLVHLDANRLSGRFPPEIAQLPLVVLNVSGNNFSGAIPAELGGVPCLQSLDLSRNNFSGGLPMTLNGLSELNKFNVSYNPLLSGVIPASGQLPTFDRYSFLGDPLITFATDHAPVPRPASTSGRWQAWRSAFPGFLFLAAIFITAGVLSFICCTRTRSSVDPELEAVVLDTAKRTSNAEEWTPSTSGSGCSKPLDDEVKVYRLDKTAFTYEDILMATMGFSEGMVVGRGGYGVVYRGILPDGRRVAIKRLERREGRGGGDEEEREFRAEMQVLAGRTGFGAGSAHPNLVTLYGWCLAGSVKLLVYEYMDGGNLEEVISDWERFGSHRRLETAVGVARALVFLHHECRPAVVHRDVKASNVLLDRQWGGAKVTDFGLARVMGSENSYVSTVVAGTVGYVAPEYAQTWRATTRGDVYSYGMLAMELATGCRAVDGREEESLLEKVRRLAAERKLEAALTAESKEGAAAMCELLRVALHCTAEAPQARPDMKEVLLMLLGIGPEGGGGGGGGKGTIL